MLSAKKWLSAFLLSAVCAVALAPVAALADPSLTGVYPNRAPMEAFVTIYGENFGDTQGTGYVTIGGRAVPVLNWTAGAIHVVVNPLAYSHAPVALDTIYPVQVHMGRGGAVSNNMELMITSAGPEASPAAASSSSGDPADPSFECVNKTLFCPGDFLTIFGAGFGFSQGTGFVTISVPLLDSHGNVIHQEFAIPVLSWSENAIYTVLNLPSGALPGNYTVTVHLGNGSTVSGPFKVGVLMNGSCMPVIAPAMGTPQITITFVGTFRGSFGDLPVGHTAGPLCFTITNTGTARLDISDISITHCSDSVDPVYVDCSAVAGFAIVSGGSPGSLAPGESRNVCITFSPKKAATFDGHVIITSNAPGAPRDVMLHGTGD